MSSPADGLDVALAQVVEHLADVEVLLHRGAEQLEARVARELLDLVAANKGKKEDKLLVLAPHSRLNKNCTISTPSCLPRERTSI